MMDIRYDDVRRTQQHAGRSFGAYNGDPQTCDGHHWPIVAAVPNGNDLSRIILFDEISLLPPHFNDPNLNRQASHRTIGFAKRVRGQHRDPQTIR